MSKTLQPIASKPVQKMPVALQAKPLVINSVEMNQLQTVNNPCQPLTLQVLPQSSAHLVNRPVEPVRMAAAVLPAGPVNVSAPVSSQVQVMLTQQQPQRGSSVKPSKSSGLSPCPQGTQPVHGNPVGNCPIAFNLQTNVLGLMQSPALQLQQTPVSSSLTLRTPAGDVLSPVSQLNLPVSVSQSGEQKRHLTSSVQQMKGTELPKMVRQPGLQSCNLLSVSNVQGNSSTQNNMQALVIQQNGLGTTSNQQLVYNSVQAQQAIPSVALQQSVPQGIRLQQLSSVIQTSQSISLKHLAPVQQANSGITLHHFAGAPQANPGIALQELSSSSQVNPGVRVQPVASTSQTNILSQPAIASPSFASTPQTNPGITLQQFAPRPQANPGITLQQFSPAPQGDQGITLQQLSSVLQANPGISLNHLAPGKQTNPNFTLHHFARAPQANPGIALQELSSSLQVNPGVRVQQVVPTSQTNILSQPARVSASLQQETPGVVLKELTATQQKRHKSVVQSNVSVGQSAMSKLQPGHGSQISTDPGVLKNDGQGIQLSLVSPQPLIMVQSQGTRKDTVTAGISVASLSQPLDIAPGIAVSAGCGPGNFGLAECGGLPSASATVMTTTDGISNKDRHSSKEQGRMSTPHQKMPTNNFHENVMLRRNTGIINKEIGTSNSCTVNKNLTGRKRDEPRKMPPQTVVRKQPLILRRKIPEGGGTKHSSTKRKDAGGLLSENPDLHPAVIGLFETLTAHSPTNEDSPKRSEDGPCRKEIIEILPQSPSKKSDQKDNFIKKEREKTVDYNSPVHEETSNSRIAAHVPVSNHFESILNHHDTGVIVITPTQNKVFQARETSKNKSRERSTDTNYSDVVSVASSESSLNGQQHIYRQGYQTTRCEQTTMQEHSFVRANGMISKTLCSNNQIASDSGINTALRQQKVACLRPERMDHLAADIRDTKQTGKGDNRNDCIGTEVVKNIHAVSNTSGSIKLTESVEMGSINNTELASWTLTAPIHSVKYRAILPKPADTVQITHESSSVSGTTSNLESHEPSRDSNPLVDTSVIIPCKKSKLVENASDVCQINTNMCIAVRGKTSKKMKSNSIRRRKGIKRRVLYSSEHSHSDTSDNEVINFKTVNSRKRSKRRTKMRIESESDSQDCEPDQPGKCSKQLRVHIERLEMRGRSFINVNDLPQYEHFNQPFNQHGNNMYNSRRATFNRARANLAKMSVYNIDDSLSNSSFSLGSSSLSSDDSMGSDSDWSA